MQIESSVLETLRSANEDDVITALAGASFGGWPQDEADLLELFNLVIELKVAETVATNG